MKSIWYLWKEFLERKSWIFCNKDELNTSCENIVFWIPLFFFFAQNVFKATDSDVWMMLSGQADLLRNFNFISKSKTHARLNFKNLQIGKTSFEEKMLTISKRQNKMLFVLLEFSLGKISFVTFEWYSQI